MAIARVALPVGAHQLFDYWLPAGLAPERGSVLAVRLGRRRLNGVAVDIVEKSDVPLERLMPVDEVLASVPPVPGDLLDLADFVSTYYQEPIGLCIAQLLPPLGHGSRGRVALARAYRLTPAGHAALTREAPSEGTTGHHAIGALRSAGGASTDELRAYGAGFWRAFAKWRRAGWVEPMTDLAVGDATAFALNAEQRLAANAAVAEPLAFRPSLLQGVTGSGKTEVYLAAAARVIALGRQALLLVPEINLTPQLEQRIAASLPAIRVSSLHSRLAPAERRTRWLAAARGEIELMVGTRLAVFTPMPRLGLIVVDEEHDASFKQQEGVRYQARDVAIFRARLRAVPIVLGSATPSLESFAQAKRGRYLWLKLPLRATAHSALPDVRLVPTRDADNIEGITPALQQAIGQRLAKKEQALLFINRRGFAPSLLCAACGWKAMCPRCSARLVVHRDDAKLRCHHCGHAAALPSACPHCGNLDLLPLGFGTQRLERAIRGLFPDARIVRVDRDSTRKKGSFVEMRDSIAAGEVDILVGTQMLAKGHDFPRLTLVGVLGADNALYSAEFRATERLFALLEQVSGRAGRGDCAGEVVVQTDFPEHPLYRALIAHDYERYAETLLAERKNLDLPPFSHLALLAAEAKTREVLMSFLDAAAERGRAILAAHAFRCELYPAVPAGLARRAGMERGQVLVQTKDRRSLQAFLPVWRAELEQSGERRVRWSIDVDPLGFG
ncbi:MAG: primosomal protein N' [Pseudomonadota bacterium]|nr:primosomal protein N' [Pseudomonadota bacterium]